MPTFLPEGNTPLPGDNEKRSLHKIVSLLAGSDGSGGVVVASSGDNYRFLGADAATKLQFKNVDTGNFSTLRTAGTAGNETTQTDAQEA